MNSRGKTVKKLASTLELQKFYLFNDELGFFEKNVVETTTESTSVISKRRSATGSFHRNWVMKR
jgi:hypothetical protein